LGILVAVAELVSRYRDDPWSSLASWPAGLYVVVNATASVSALLLIRAFGWDFGASGATLLLTQVLVAGFGAAALFRTSFFNVTAGDQVIGIGPSAVLNVILSAADRAVDRRSAHSRSEATSESMQGISFKYGADALAMYCFAAMQNASKDEVQAVENRIALLRDPKHDAIHDQVKAYVLGLSLATIVGNEVLRDATDRLKGFVGDAEARAEPDQAAAQEPAPAQERVLGMLAQRGPMRTVTLMSDLGVDVTELASALRQLVDAGLVAVEGEGDDEMAMVT
jgi:hypothetical protein